jgi:electron transport complex protein RnfG
MISAISRNAFLLTAFAIVCTACVALVNLFTSPVIASQEQRALLKTLNQLIPADAYNNNIFASCFQVSDDQLLGKGQSQQVFIAKKDNQPVALMLETSTFRGYAGEIKLAVGIYENGQLAGVRVIQHSETPGLGDKIQSSKSDWLLAFDGKLYLPTQEQRWESREPVRPHDRQARRSR